MTSSEDSGLRSETADGRLLITIDRVERGNAVSRAMLKRLAALLQQAGDDPSLRVLVLTGAGDRDFSVGADPGEQATHAVAAHDFDRARDEVSELLAEFPALTVARLNGRCAGSGLSLALACDVRVASSEAVLSYPALADHVLPTSADVERLTALIGPSRCKAMLVAGKQLQGAEALAWRLLDEAVSATKLDAAVDALCAPALAAGAHEVLAIKCMCAPRPDYAMVDLCYRAMYDNDKSARRRLREG